MAEEWSEVQLSEIARCQGGSAFSPSLQGRKVGDIPFFKVSDMNLPENQWAMRRANNYVTDGDRPKINGIEKPAGSVIFPKVGATIFTNKKRFLLSPAFVDNNVMAVWSTDPQRCLPEFLYLHFLMLPLAELSNPGPLPSINNSKIYEQTIKLPSPSEQARMAAVLWKVQRAIEVEEKLIVTARELKQAAMRQLFTRGLRGESRKDTDYGQLPDAWPTELLGDCCIVQTGVAKGRKIPPNEAVDVPYLRVANVQDGHLDLREMKTITLRKAEVPKYLLQEGDVVVTEGGDFDKLGRGFIWHGQISNCVHQNHIFAIRANREVLLPEFLAYLVQSPYGRSYFLTVAHKTTNLACINTAKLKAFPIPLPRLDEQLEIATMLETIDGKISVHKRKHATLEQLFKTLLQELMTGKIRVDHLDIDTSEVEATA